MVKATLRSSYGVRLPDGTRKYYGPGIDIDIPEALAQTLGLPVENTVPVAVPPEPVIPDDFPGREYLQKAGYTKPAQIRALTFDELVALSGIGKATARKIITAIGELDRETF